jgi:4-amino-4-deoxy-L-arabinose transferase-like glycosyltransferase
VLISFSLILLALHFTVGNGYGFHRDELQFFDDSRHLAWGYVAYPPVTSFVGRLSTSLFGISPSAFRLPATLAGMTILTLCGLICREFGGSLQAQLLALFAALASQVILGSLMLYVVWDFLAWTLVCFFLARLLRTENDRWWIAVGASFGIGILCKYSIVFLSVSIIFGLVCLPSMRRSFRQPYLYLGVLAGLLIAAPNLLWEERHGWVSLKMLSTIHARDVRLGRTSGFVSDQFQYTMAGVVLAVAGLTWLLRSRRFRLLAFFFLGPLVLFLIARGRGYYLLPAYTPLYAAGAIWAETEISKRVRPVRLSMRSVAFMALSLDAVAIAAMMLPVAKPGSALFRYQMTTSSDMRDETGWPEFVGQIARVRDTLSPTI